MNSCYKITQNLVSVLVVSSLLLFTAHSTHASYTVNKSEGFSGELLLELSESVGVGDGDGYISPQEVESYLGINSRFFQVVEVIEELNAASVKVKNILTLSQATTLLRDNHYVKSISYNSPRTAHLNNNVETNPDFHKQNLFNQVDMTSVWNQVYENDINKITVAVLDTGVDSAHEDLQDSIVKGYDFINNDDEPQDDSPIGHGTHVTGIIASSNNQVGIVGVAPGVKIMPVKVLNSNLSGNILSIVKGIIYAADQGAKIINLSLGGDRFDIHGKDTFNKIEYAAIQYAINKGVVVTASTGNENSAVSYPAAYPGVVAVSSIDDSEEVSSFSNHGEEVTISAPGENILSTVPGHNYTLASGTSFAAPIVSGIAALLISQKPDLKPYEIKQLIAQGARDLGPIGHDDGYGFGVITPNKSWSLPQVKLKASSSNIYTPEAALNFRLQVEDSINGNTESIEYSSVTVSTYHYNMIAEKSYNGYYYGEPTLKQQSVYQIVYAPLDISIIAPDLGFFEIQVAGAGLAGSNFKFVQFPAIPKANYISGTYSEPIELALTASSVSDSVYFTTNGRNPINKGQLIPEAIKYEKPLIVDNDVTIKAVIISGMYTSSTATFKYQIIKNRIPYVPLRGSQVNTQGPLIEEEYSILTDTFNGIANTSIVLNPSNLETVRPWIIQVQNLESSSNDKQLVTLPFDSLVLMVKENRSVIIESLDLQITVGHETVKKLLSMHATDMRISIHLLEDKRLESIISNNINKNTSLTYSLLSNGYEIESLVFSENKILEWGTTELPLISVKVNAKLYQEGFWEEYQLKIIDFSNSSVALLHPATYVGKQKFILNETNQNKFVVAGIKTNFLDIGSHPAEEAIEILTQKHFIDGISPTYYNPDAQMTRAEYLALLVRAFKLNPQVYDNSFTDVDSADWYAGYIASAKKHGIISGTGNELFEPQKLITIEEAFIMLIQCYMQKHQLTENYLTEGRSAHQNLEEFTARDNISLWAVPFVKVAVHLDLIVSEKDLNPKGGLTRGEAAIVLNRYFNIVEQTN